VLRTIERVLLLLLLLLHDLLLMADKRVLFICVENAGRSLMAEAMFNADPPIGWEAISAGTNPANTANPRTGPMLKEVGLLLPEHPPRLLSKELMEAARVRITMGCLDDASCPAHLKNLELRDWALPDPAKLDDDGFREVRDRLRALVRGLRSELVLRDRQAADLVHSARR
jgi:arsenate reductase (thioredoxin)